jgi:predicted nucleic acid-binding protein
VVVTPIFIDANVPIYATGRSHELKESCAQVILMADQRPELFWTDAEVLQELLHRFRTSDSWAVNRARIESFAELMHGRVEPLTDDDVLHAASLVDRYSRLSARDLVHLAVIARLGITSIVSADSDFDIVPGLRRLDPRDVVTWRAEIG